MRAALAAARETITPVWVLFGILRELTKARLTAMVLITTLTGFFVARTGTADWLAGLHVLMGTGLVAAGAAVLNEWWERDWDRLMDRTSGRPLPAGQVEPGFALALGISFGAGGLVYLAWLVNELTALLGALALASYVLVYTPMKRTTPWNTLVGAVPGALPPLMGWTAARGEIGVGGLGLFGILFLWQIPHFMAIAWLYREQYARAGFRMLPVVDPEGRATGRTTLISSVVLLATSLIPVWVGVSGMAYGSAAVVLGLFFVWASWEFTKELDRRRARMVFFASILYLPLLLGMMMLDSIFRGRS